MSHRSRTRGSKAPVQDQSPSDAGSEAVPINDNNNNTDDSTNVESLYVQYQNDCNAYDRDWARKEGSIASGQFSNSTSKDSATTKNLQCARRPHTSAIKAGEALAASGDEVRAEECYYRAGRLDTRLEGSGLPDFDYTSIIDDPLQGPRSRSEVKEIIVARPKADRPDSHNGEYTSRS